MQIELTEDERRLLGFNLACRLEDYEKTLRKHNAFGPNDFGRKEWQKLEKLVYTKIIPESWVGKKPDYWDEI